MKRFLFILNGVTPIDEMTSLGKALELKSNIESYYFITKKEFVENLERSGISRERIMYPPKLNSWFYRFFIFKIIAELKFCEKLLKKFQIHGIGLYGDFNLSFCLSFIRASQILGIKSFVLPIAISNPAFIATSRLRYEKKSSTFGKLLVKLLWPRQMFYIQGTEIPFYPFSKTIILFLLKMLPPNPWYMGAGRADQVFLQFSFQKDQLLSIGVRPEKIHVTGQSAFDSLEIGFQEEQQLRNEIFQIAGFSKEKKTIMLAVPQLAEHKLMSWDEHWNIINDLIGRLKSLNCQVILSLHPKMNSKQYERYTEKGSVYLSPYPLKKIMPLADCFVAGFASTVYWALALNIPVLFLSYLNLGYTFKDVQGVQEIWSLSEIDQGIISFIGVKKSSVRESSRCVDKMISIIEHNI